jgi:hypothetical protein
MRRRRLEMPRSTDIVPTLRGVEKTMIATIYARKSTEQTVVSDKEG